MKYLILLAAIATIVTLVCYTSDAEGKTLQVCDHGLIHVYLDNKWSLPVHVPIDGYMYPLTAVA